MTCDEALERIQQEYREMPDLKLTLPQVRRLCDLPQDLCEIAINTLLNIGFLKQVESGRLLLATQEQSSPAARASL
jgi:hypothetical protein